MTRRIKRIDTPMKSQEVNTPAKTSKITFSERPSVGFISNYDLSRIIIRVPSENAKNLPHGLELHEEEGVAFVNDEALRRVVAATNPEDYGSLLIAKAKNQELERARAAATEAAKTPEQRAQEAADKAERAQYRQWLWGWNSDRSSHPIEDYRLSLSVRPVFQYTDAFQPVVDSAWGSSDEARKVVMYLKKGRLLSMGKMHKNVLSGVALGRGIMCCPQRQWGYPEYAWDYILAHGAKPEQEFIDAAIAFGKESS